MEELEKKHNELWEAASSDNLNFVKEAWKDTNLLAYAEDFASKSVFYPCGASMYLTAASNSGSEQVIDWLIDNHTFTQKGLDNAFSYSCSGGNGKLSIVKKLYDAGANPIAYSGTEGIWYYAKNNKYTDILDYLESCGANVRKKNHTKEVNTQQSYLRKTIDTGINKLNKKAVPISFSKKSKITAEESYIGKNYFLPKNIETPLDKEDNKLGFLVQINLEQIDSFIGLPKKGLLQFFVKNENYRWDFESKVFFHENTATDDWTQFSSDFDLDTVELQFSQDVTMFPSVRSIEVNKIEKGVDPDKVSHLEKNDQFDIIRKHCNKKNPKISNYLNGHGDFIQDDPRFNNEKIKEWVLLLQLDGFDKKNELWGRNSIAYWFIDPKDLKENNFDSVYFCYQKG